MSGLKGRTYTYVRRFWSAQVRATLKRAPIESPARGECRQFGSLSSTSWLSRHIAAVESQQRRLFAFQKFFVRSSWTAC